MKKETLLVESAGNGGRLDRYLAARYPSWSRTRLQRLIDLGSVLLDGAVVPSNEKLKAGQTITLTWPEPRLRQGSAGQAKRVPADFPILYEDKDIIVVDKPAGLVVHPAVGHHDGNTLVEILEPKMADGAWPDDVRHGLVHRLDRDTSGVIVLAKTPEVQMKLSKQFSDRKVKKTYVGLVYGRVKPDNGALESNLARHPGMRQRYAVSEKGRWALTHFQVVERFGEEATLLELTPFTGRTHQIRVQIAAFGHAIIGDHVYGPRNKDMEGVTRHLLHAAQLELTHPRTGVQKRFTAPLPRDFQAAIKLIRLKS